MAAAAPTSLRARSCCEGAAALAGECLAAAGQSRGFLLGLLGQQAMVRSGRWEPCPISAGKDSAVYSVLWCHSRFHANDIA